MKSIYLPKLINISVENYTFYEQQFTFKFDFQDGISAILGANGVGKTTFINMIIYCLVGYKKEIKGRNKDKKTIYINSDYFKNRMNTEYDVEFNAKASATLVFKLNNSYIEVKRSLIENKIIDLKVNNEVIKDISFEKYESIICEISNIPFFKDFELIIREFLLFDESRENVAWEVDTQGEILRILLLDNNLYTKYTELQENITMYDSKGRHASENQRMAEEAYDDLIKEKSKVIDKSNKTNESNKKSIDASTKENGDNSIENLIEKKAILEKSIGEIKESVDTNNKFIFDFIDKNKYLSGNKESVKIGIEQVDELCGKLESKLYSSYYDALPDYYYTIEHALAKNGECLVCGTKSKKLKEINEVRIKNNKCLICSSELKVKNSVDKDLINKINKYNSDRQIMINKFENIQKEIDFNNGEIKRYRLDNESYSEKCYWQVLLEKFRQIILPKFFLLVFSKIWIPYVQAYNFCLSY